MVNTTLQEKIDPRHMPKHIAIIMDGNGRWANQKGKARIFGHRNALDAVKDSTETAARIGVKHLTLYAFSTENWKRPEFEINYLFKLLENFLEKKLPYLNKQNIKLKIIGRKNFLPKRFTEGSQSTRL